MLIRWHIAAPVAIAALFLTIASHSQDPAEVAHKYLQRHAVPCPAVMHVDRTQLGMDMIATCQDGREWALFIVEGDVAFVHPRTRDLYRWQREVYCAHPELYTTKSSASDEGPPVGAGDGQLGVDCRRPPFLILGW